MSTSEQFIDITYEDLGVLMSDFEKEIKDMQQVLSDVDDKTRDVSSIWDGEESEGVMTDFTNFKKEFDTVNEENKKYLEFIETVIEKYKKRDEDTSSFLDEKASSFDFID